MELRLADANLILGKTPACLDLLLRDLPDEWLRANEGKDTWSCYDVVGHLIHGELTDWMPRLQIILERGADRAFVPFDRFAQFENDQTRPIGELLDRFKSLRQQNLRRIGRDPTFRQPIQRLLTDLHALPELLHPHDIPSPHIANV